MFFFLKFPYCTNIGFNPIDTESFAHNPFIIEIVTLAPFRRIQF